MLDFGYYNMDCMDGMREFPDKFFDLAIVDPPYGINVGSAAMGIGGVSRHTETDRRREAVRKKKDRPRRRFPLTS